MGRQKDREIDKDEAWKEVALETGVGKCEICGDINPQRGEPWWGGRCPNCAHAFDPNSNE